VGFGSVTLASLRHKGGNLCRQEAVVIDAQFIPEFGWRLRSGVAHRQHLERQMHVT